MISRQDLINSLGVCMTLASLLSACGGSVAEGDIVPADQSAHTELNLEQWADVIAKTPVPKAGCFQASHPSMVWNEVECVVAPDHPHLSKRFASDRPPAIDPAPATGTQPPSTDNGVRVQSLNPAPAVNGGGYSDFMAVVPFSRISRAVGTFPSVTNVISVADDQSGPGAYSLQINSNVFAINADGACSGHAATCQDYSTNCRCWQQFVLDNPSPLFGSGSTVYMQYWLLNVGEACPASGGWIAHQGHCYRNSGATHGPIWVNPVNLANIRLIGDANAGGNDTVTLVYGSTAYARSETDNQFGLAKGWNQAEFNIFGEHGGSSANFNSGAKLVVKENVTSQMSTGTNAVTRPFCVAQTTTGERNNLTYVHSCCPTGGRPAILAGQSPAIQFEETNGSITAEDPPYCLSASLTAGVSWPMLPGTAQDIGAGIGAGNDTVWIVDSNTYIQKWISTSNTWFPSNRSGASRIAVQADGIPWYVGTNGSIFQGTTNNPATVTWSQRAGCATDIGIGTDGSVWIVGCSPVNGGYGMFKWTGTTWQGDVTGGGATRIAVDSTGKPWIVNSHSEIFQRSSAVPTNGYWQIVSGGARDIGVGPEGYPWIIGTSVSPWGSYSIFAWDDQLGTWKSVDGGGSQITVGRNGRPWITNSSGSIFRGN
jgi:hypothetical protein